MALRFNPLFLESVYAPGRASVVAGGVSGRQEDDGGALRAARTGGFHRPVDARRQPDQVAPGPYDLVLRDVPARTRSLRLSPRLPRIQLPLQLLLQRRRRADRPQPPGDALAADDRPGAALSRDDRRPHGRLARLGRRGDARTTRPGRHPRPEPRAAAPGTDRHRPQAPPLVQPATARLPRPVSCTGRWCVERHGLVRRRGGPALDRVRGGRIRVRQ